jgi:hypothetical protein
MEDEDSKLEEEFQKYVVLKMTGKIDVDMLNLWRDLSTYPENYNHEPYYITIVQLDSF